MKIKDFIEKAIEGGWDKNRAKVVDLDMRDGHEGLATSMQSTDKMFLDPLAWQAVGKVEGWKNTIYCPVHPHREDCECGLAPFETAFGWQDKMHRMIDALAEGKTIEQYLETL